MHSRTPLISVNWSNQNVPSLIRLYYHKVTLLVLWIVIYSVLSQGMFIARFIIALLVSFLMLISFSRSFQELKNKSPHLFFYLLFYTMLPNSISEAYLILGIVMISIVIEVLFKHYDAFIFHPTLMIYLLIILFNIPLEFDFLLKTQIGYLLDTNLLSSITVFLDKDIQLLNVMSGAIGFSILSLFQPSLMLMILLMLFFNKDSKLYFLFSIRYILYTFFFISIVTICYSLMNQQTIRELTMNIFHAWFYDIFLSPVFFIALFILPESLTSIQSINGKKKVAVIAAFFTSLFFMHHVIILGSFMSIFLAQLLTPFFYEKRSKKQLKIILQKEL